MFLKNCISVCGGALALTMYLGAITPYGGGNGQVIPTKGLVFESPATTVPRSTNDAKPSLRPGGGHTAPATEPLALAAPSDGSAVVVKSQAGSADKPSSGAAALGPATVAKGVPAPTLPKVDTVAPNVSVTAKAHGVPDEYQIGSGDVLQIAVWKEPDASVPSVVVRPDGKIGLPLLKEANVAGLTPTQAEQIITEGLEKFIPGADVTVVVTSINSKKVYVVGAVKKEGPIAYTYRMTVMQALSEAGGLTDYAKRKKIYVLRSQNGKTFKLPFDYNAVLKGEHMELNVPLIPSDTLVVPH